jgi:hypothetical protein
MKEILIELGVIGGFFASIYMVICILGIIKIVCVNFLGKRHINYTISSILHEGEKIMIILIAAFLVLCFLIGKSFFI